MYKGALALKEYVTRDFELANERRGQQNNIHMQQAAIRERMIRQGQNLAADNR